MIFSPFKVAVPLVAFTVAFVPVVRLLVAFKLTSLPVTFPFTVISFLAVMFAFSAAVTLPATTALFAAMFASLPAIKLPVSVFSKFSVALTSILPFGAVTVPLLVILLPFKVTLPSFAITAASSKISNSPVVFKVTFAPSIEPPTVASLALTVTSFLATKLPESVFTKESVAFTLTLPAVAFTSPSLTMVVAFKLTSFSVASISEPGLVAIAFASISTSFAFRLPVSVLVKFSIASTSILPFSAVTVPLLVMFSPFKVAVPLVALTFAPSSTVKLPVTFRVTFEPDTLPATSAFVAFTVAFSFATKLPVGVFVNLFTASTATFAAFTVPLLVMSLPFNAASPSVDFTVAFSPIFKVSVAFNVTSSFAVMVAFGLTVTLVAFTSTVALSDVTFPPTVASFASIVTASFAFKLPVSVLVKLFVASTSIVPFGDTTVPLLVMFSPFKVAVPLVAFTVAFSPMSISVAFKVIFAPLIFPLVVSAVAFTVTFSLALMLEFSAVVKLVTSKVALVAFTVPLFVKSVDVTAKLPVTFNVPLPVISALLPLMFKPESEFTVVFTLTARSPLEESVAFAPLKLSGFAPVIVKSPPSRLLISDLV